MVTLGAYSGDAVSGLAFCIWASSVSPC